MNFHSPEWKEICDKIDKRIAELDRTNRGPLDHDQTCEIRGQIKALAELRAWKPAPEPEPEIAYLR